MKRQSLTPKRDSTGLACVFAMGVLILLAWATVPPSSALEAVRGERTGTAVSLVAPAAAEDDPIRPRIASDRH